MTMPTVGHQMPLAGLESAGRSGFVPHPIPYQGSKRKLASLILSYVPLTTRALVEPFAGSAAISLAAAVRWPEMALRISDSLEALGELWRLIVDRPGLVADEYERIWQAQLGDPAAHYLQVREQFNADGSPFELMYLLARCVKNSPRFNDQGQFNQSADHRRLGMRPEKLRRHVLRSSELLSGRATANSGDYRDALSSLPSDAVVYMDPPYQGVSGDRDPRYYEQLNLQEFVGALSYLNDQGVDYLISFDGQREGREIGAPLPEELGLSRVLIDAGVSSQGTLLGRSIRTIESLYLSPRLAALAAERIERQPELVAL